VGWFFAFLFMGFLSVTFARVTYVGFAKGVSNNPFDKRWLGGTVGIIGVSVAAAMVIGSLITGQYVLLLEWLAEVIKLLIGMTIFVLSIPGLLLSYVLGPLFPIFLAWFSKSNPNPANLKLYPGPYLPTQHIQELKPLPASLQALLFWLVIAVMLIAMILRARRATSARQKVFPDEPESLLKEGEARKLLRQALQDSFESWSKRFRLNQRRAAAAHIRRIYIQLLDLCEELNIPRASHKTPLEFLADMGEYFTELGAELSLITQAYLRVRYGEYPETEEQVEIVERAWERISDEGNRLKRTGFGKLRTTEYKEVSRTGV
jgi:hypothetical protein